MTFGKDADAEVLYEGERRGVSMGWVDVKKVVSGRGNTVIFGVVGGWLSSVVGLGFCSNDVGAQRTLHIGS